MNKLESLIAQWRAGLKTSPEVSAKTLDELENHLRETLAPLLRSGLNETEAFERAVRQLGATPALAAEFQKLNLSGWLPVRIAAGTGIVLALGMAVTLAAHFHSVKWSLLLCSHIFTLTMGYVTALLTGVLGICFAGQRCYSPFSDSRQPQLARATFYFTLVAVCLTGIGLLLGTWWSRTELGRWWQWEAKSTTAFCVLIWLLCFLLVHQWRGISARTLLVMSIAGNMLVSLAWFGPFLINSGHQYNTPGLSPILQAVLLLHLAFLLTGLAPAKWLRLGKA